MEHAYFHGVGTDIVEYRADLPLYEIHRNRMHAIYPHGVLVNHGDNG